MKIGIIDVGGGFRDIYGAGVLDVCMEQGIQFDSCIGISAGSANLASYLSHQPGRSYTFYMEYVFRKEYASLENWLKTRNYVDLDYIYDTLSNSDGENPVDYEAMEKNPAEFLVGACNALTGEPVYFDKSYLRKDHYDIFKASCALPVFCKPYMVVLILTRPVSQPREAKKDRVIADLLSRTYPKAGACMRMRYKTYNDGVARAQALQAQGKVLIIAPDDICGLSTLTKDREKLQRMYDKGVRDAQAIPAFLNT